MLLQKVKTENILSLVHDKFLFLSLYVKDYRGVNVFFWDVQIFEGSRSYEGRAHLGTHDKSRRPDVLVFLESNFCIDEHFSIEYETFDRMSDIVFTVPFSFKIALIGQCWIEFVQYFLSRWFQCVLCLWILFKSSLFFLLFLFLPLLDVILTFSCQLFVDTL